MKKIKIYNLKKSQQFRDQKKIKFTFFLVATKKERKK